MAVAVFAYFVLPRDPKHAGFLNEREQLVASERIRVENAGLVSPDSWYYSGVELTLLAE